METGPLKELTLKSLEKGAWINIVAPTPYDNIANKSVNRIKK